MVPRSGHDQASAHTERPEEFPECNVETDGCLLKHRIGAAQGLKRLSPPKAVVQ